MSKNNKKENNHPATTEVVPALERDKSRDIKCYTMIPPEPGSAFLQVVELVINEGEIVEINPLSSPEYKHIAYAKLKEAILGMV